jgi:hypothetical protein
MTKRFRLDEMFVIFGRQRGFCAPWRNVKF